MGVKKIVKGLAAGAVLAGVASLVVSMRDEKNRKAAKELHQAAHQIKERVTKHAKNLGTLTKSAYGKIVDTTVAEYRGVKELSEADLREIRSDLKESWNQVQSILNSRRGKPAGAAKSMGKNKPSRKKS